MNGSPHTAPPAPAFKPTPGPLSKKPEPPAVPANNVDGPVPAAPSAPAFTPEEGIYARIPDPPTKE